MSSPRPLPSIDALPQPKLLHVLLLSTFAAYQTDALADATGTSTVAQVEFDSQFLFNSPGRSLDISRFEQGEVVPPGVYSVDIVVNEDRIARGQVSFDASAAGQNAHACFDKALLARVGVDLRKLSPEVMQKLDVAGACVRLEDIVPGATSDFDFGEQQLNLSIPQVSLARSARGYVSPDQWDSGVTAAMLGYDLNLYDTSASGSGNSSQGYLGLSGGVNIGNWHFRHSGAYTFDSRGKQQYQDIATYVQRDLPSLSSQLTIGETYTSGELFDSTSYRGVGLKTDDRMLPDSLRGYAPTVRGVANSNAKVTIRQNGVVLYQTTVAPGAFEINDLYPTGYGGDLRVSVEEADGRVSTFSVPYASVPLSLRPGQNRYSFVAGTVRDTSLSNNPLFAQATWQHGFTNLFTGYAGVTVAEGYASGLVGGAFNTPFGAIGVDATQSIVQLPGQGHMSGSSFRVSYAKTLPVTGTDIAIAAYRYSTSGYFGLNSAMQAREQSKQNVGIASVSRQRSSASITLGQRLGEHLGQVNLTGSAVNYWNRPGSDINYSFSYNNAYRNISYSVSAQRQHSAYGKSSTLYYASVTIPLGKTHPAIVSGRVTHDSDGSTQTQADVSGSLGANSELSYGVTGNVTSGGGNGVSQSGSGNLLYHSRFADFSASAGAGKGYTQGSIGVRGAVVAHPGGVTLSQPISDTIGIVQAPDAEGASVVNASGVRVDSRGYAIVPYLTPYNLNTIELDPKDISTDVEMHATSLQVAPRAGAAVLLKYATASGRAMLIQARHADGTPLPFGATVTNESGANVGTVGQASRIIARTQHDKGTLAVNWGKNPASTCRIAYELPMRDKHTKARGYERIDATCE